MKFVLIFVLSVATIKAHYYDQPVARPHYMRRNMNSIYMNRYRRSRPDVRVEEVNLPNLDEVLPQFVDEVEYENNNYPVCGIDGRTYMGRLNCPVRVAYEGRCRPRYAYDTYWYMPHGWELYQPDGQHKRSRDLYGYHKHVMPPYYHA